MEKEEAKEKLREFTRNQLKTFKHKDGSHKILIKSMEILKYSHGQYYVICKCSKVEETLVENFYILSMEFINEMYELTD